MPQTFITIRGVDPLLFRDGRPFTSNAGGLTARSLALPFPTTVAAFIRGQIGTAMGWTWNHDDCLRAHSIVVLAPLLMRDGVCVFPAPGDALLTPGATPGDAPLPKRLLPCGDSDAGGTDNPDGMFPLTVDGTLPPLKATDQGRAESGGGKPPKGYLFWTRDAMLGWLEGNAPERLDRIGGLPEEERIGIEIDKVTHRAADKMLYATQLRAFEEAVRRGEDRDAPVCERHQYALIARANLKDDLRYLPTGTLGGERRLTVLETVADTPDIWPHCPATLKAKLGGAKRVRMVLTTPAHFGGGWKPDWIARSGGGEAHLPAGIAKVRLKLVAAAVGRRVPVSGWGMRENVPRPVRWLVPAGSVYFFEVVGGDPAALHEDAWMKPTSDDEQDRRDGLGLALWGTW